MSAVLPAGADAVRRPRAQIYRGTIYAATAGSEGCGAGRMGGGGAPQGDRCAGRARGGASARRGESGPGERAAEAEKWHGRWNGDGNAVQADTCRHRGRKAAGEARGHWEPRGGGARTRGAARERRAPVPSHGFQAMARPVWRNEIGGACIVRGRPAGGTCWAWDSEDPGDWWRSEAVAGALLPMAGRPPGRGRAAQSPGRPAVEIRRRSWDKIVDPSAAGVLLCASRPSCRSGGIGRHAVFRAPWAKACVGSNPTSGTKIGSEGAGYLARRLWPPARRYVARECWNWQTGTFEGRVA